MLANRRLAHTGLLQKSPEASRHRCHRAGVRAIEGVRYQDSIWSLSLALTFSWLTLHSAISMSSRTLPKYFA